MNSNNSDIGSGPVSRASSAASGASGQSAISGLTANSLSSNKQQSPIQPLEEMKEGPSKLTAENLAQLKPSGNEGTAEFAETQRKLNIHTVQEGQKRLAEIKSERKELRTKLDQF